MLRRQLCPKLLVLSAAYTGDMSSGGGSGLELVVRRREENFSKTVVNSSTDHVHSFHQTVRVVLSHAGKYVRVSFTPDSEYRDCSRGYAAYFAHTTQVNLLQVASSC